jgi:cobalt-zinc-cadmium efflux system outer membrane protein
MHARWLVSLGIVVAVISPSAAGGAETVFSLEELRAFARAAHPTMESAEAAYTAATSMAAKARAYPNPEIALGVGRGRPRDGGDARSENTIDLVQPIEMPGIRRWRAHSAGLRVRSAEIDRDLAGLVVDSSVSRLAYTVVLEQRRLEVAREIATIASRFHDLLARRVELGESSPMEAIRARAEWFSRRGDVVEAESSHSVALATLNLFCGGRLPERYGVSATLEGPGPVPLPTDLVWRLHDRNPLLQRAAIAAEESKGAITAARKEVFPRLDLVAGHETELDRTAAKVGVAFTIPLWNRNRHGVAVATAEHNRTTAESRTLEIELETALGQAGAAYRRALAAIRLHEEGWTAAARESFQIATFSFENGEASLLEVLDAQRSYLGVKFKEAESWAELALARTEIEQLIAGPLISETNDEKR